MERRSQGMTPGADPSGVTRVITHDPDDTASEQAADFEFEARSATPILRGGGVRGSVIRSRWARGFSREFEKQNYRRGIRVSAAFRRLLVWEIVDFIRASALLLPQLKQRKPS